MLLVPWTKCSYSWMMLMQRSLAPIYLEQCNWLSSHLKFFPAQGIYIKPWEMNSTLNSQLVLDWTSPVAVGPWYDWISNCTDFVVGYLPTTVGSASNSPDAILTTVYISHEMQQSHWHSTHQLWSSILVSPLPNPWGSRAWWYAPHVISQHWAE